MIDFWALAADFKVGGTVQRILPQGLSPFVGKVTSVNPGLGTVDVQWPTGNERVSADELIRVNPSMQRYLPPTLDQTYSSYDTKKASKTPWRTLEVPKGFHLDLAKLWSKSASELTAYDELWHRYEKYATDHCIKDEVEKFYKASANLADMRIQSGLTPKTAAYWIAQNRQYRVTADELTNKRPLCPKCGNRMRKATYKMEEGTKHRLFACPKDLFLIERSSLYGPDGSALEW